MHLQRLYPFPHTSPEKYCCAEREAAESLAAAETRIKAIRSKFDKQKARLVAKKEAVDAETRECEAEARAIAQARKEHALARKKVRYGRELAGA